jgi:O-antigen/teichoic acid export membrane protein
MLYCDAIIDAINKGLGQQKVCVRINIFTSVVDVVGLFLLLPLWGMEGYFISFLISHGVNIILSLALLLKSCDLGISPSVPMLTLAVMAGGILTAEMVPFSLLKGLIFLPI